MTLELGIQALGLKKGELISTLHGCVNFEYILDKKGGYHFIECNPRFSAGAEFSHLAGYDLVKNHIRCYSGEHIEQFSSKHHMIITRKYKEYITKIDGKEKIIFDER